MIIVFKYLKFIVFDFNSNVFYYFSSSDLKKFMMYMNCNLILNIV